MLLASPNTPEWWFVTTEQRVLAGRGHDFLFNRLMLAVKSKKCCDIVAFITFLDIDIQESGASVQRCADCYALKFIEPFYGPTVNQQISHQSMWRFVCYIFASCLFWWLLVLISPV